MPCITCFRSTILNFRRFRCRGIFSYVIFIRNFRFFYSLNARTGTQSESRISSPQYFMWNISVYCRNSFLTTITVQYCHRNTFSSARQNLLLIALQILLDRDILLFICCITFPQSCAISQNADAIFFTIERFTSYVIHTQIRPLYHESMTLWFGYTCKTDLNIATHRVILPQIPEEMILKAHVSIYILHE